MYRKHKYANTKVYRAYYQMKTRCYNKNHTNYKYYGGRGIKVCKRWLHSFENFLKDIGEPPSKEHSLDRIDSNGNYEPDNCKWSTQKEQIKNRRSFRKSKYRGVFQGRKKWISSIYLGQFDTEKEASNIYEKCLQLLKEARYV